MSFCRLFAFAHQLQDACRWWLSAEVYNAEDVIDVVVLEQFVVWLPGRTAERVQCHCPASLDEVTQLAEDHLVAFPVAGGHPTFSLSFSCFPFSPPSPSPYPMKAGASSLSPRSPSPCLPFSSPAQVGDSRVAGVEVRSGPVCWRCREPRHFQNQCHMMEVGGGGLGGPDP